MIRRRCLRQPQPIINGITMVLLLFSSLLLLLLITTTTTTTSAIIATTSAFTITTTTSTTTPTTTIRTRKGKNFHRKKRTSSTSTSTRIYFSISDITTTITTIPFHTLHFDDILYQTQNLGNTLASFTLQQQQSHNTDSMNIIHYNNNNNNMIMNTGTATATATSNNNNILFAFPIMYMAGLLTSFSPCVWGLLPLTISYISTAANERQDHRTILPTIAFALGLASVFCTMGMITVFTVGTVFGGSSSSSASTITGSTTSSHAMTLSSILPILSNFVCFIMGLKLLELIDITLPSLSKFLDPQVIFSTNKSAASSFSTTTTTTTATVMSSRTTGGIGPILLDGTGRQITSTGTSRSSSSRNLASTLNTNDISMIDNNNNHQNNNDDNNNNNNYNDNSNNDNNALFRTFLLGGSSALVASPCATPVLTSILAYVANTIPTSFTNEAAASLGGGGGGEGTMMILSTIISTLIGGFLLFGYTLGYSTPLLIVAATGGQALVKLKQQQQQQNENMESESSSSSTTKITSFLYTIPNRIAPWVTPITGGILLYLGTTGLLMNILGDPSLSGLTIIE